MEKGKDHVCDENGCDCGGEMETVTLTLEDGSLLECNILGTYDVEENEYIALAPVDGDEALIYKFVQDDEGNVTLSMIEDDDEFQRVSVAFYELFGEDDEELDEEE